jgi:hypothetical protein
MGDVADIEFLEDNSSRTTQGTSFHERARIGICAEDCN